MMHKIHVQETYRQDIDEIFKLISNHESFLSGKNISCKLLKKGNKDVNGVGAIRQIVTNKMTFEEEILEFTMNKSFSYVITSITPKQPIDHKKGWLTFETIGGKTHVNWYSHFKVTTPVIGFFIGLVVKKQMAKAFSNLLFSIKKTD